MGMWEQKLRADYSSHSHNVTPSAYFDSKAFDAYYKANYGLILELPRDSKILEIGSGSGSLLSYLARQGFSDIQGVEVSPSEAEHARRNGLKVVEADVVDFLSNTQETYDLIVMKAVLEHFPRDSGLHLLDLIHQKLNGGGAVFVDVPNMDWVFASHERYMDLTHHTGFTESSLSQALSLNFNSVHTFVSKPPLPANWKQFVAFKLLRPLVVSLLRRTLVLWGDGAESVSFQSRNLIGVGTKQA